MEAALPFRTEKEIDKRIEKIDGLKDRIDQLRTEVTMSLAGHSFNNVSLNDDEESKRFVRGEDGEYEDTRDKDEGSILSMQKQRLDRQDDQLDAISGIV